MTTPTYRKLTKAEVLDLANRIRFADDIDLRAIRKGVLDLFGAAAHKVTLFWGSEYNDETYYHRPSDIMVWDAAGKRLERPKAEDDYDEELEEFLSDLSFGETMESDDGLGEMTIFVNDKAGLNLPDLYVYEGGVQ